MLFRSRFWQETASTDSLTGLPNRRSFMDRLRLDQCPGMSGQYGAVMIIDIDHFKTVNDTFGHDAGDMALRRVADALRGTSYNDDMICRLGGEEFAIFTCNVLPAGIADRAEEYRAAIERQLVRYGKKTIPLTVSIGVANWTNALDVSIDDMLRAADVALYEAKANGRNCVVFSNYNVSVAAASA